ncbi:MAG: hypothetical protein ACO2PM_14760, partial [Pyrobaculum sp.]
MTAEVQTLNPAKGVWKKLREAFSASKKRCGDVFFAIYVGDVECVKRLLEGGAGPNPAHGH